MSKNAYWKVVCQLLLCEIEDCHLDATKDNTTTRSNTSKMSDKIINNEKDDDWSLVIRPQNSLFSIDFREIWRYRDLCAMLIKRDIVTMYKQTVLGPLVLIKRRFLLQQFDIIGPG